MVQRLIADAQVLVQSAQQLEVRLDKDVTKLQVSHHSVPALALISPALVWVLTEDSRPACCYLGT